MRFSICSFGTHIQALQNKDLMCVDCWEKSWIVSIWPTHLKIICPCTMSKPLTTPCIFSKIVGSVQSSIFCSWGQHFQPFSQISKDTLRTACICWDQYMFYLLLWAHNRAFWWLSVRRGRSSHYPPALSVYGQIWSSPSVWRIQYRNIKLWMGFCSFAIFQLSQRLCEWNDKLTVLSKPLNFSSCKFALSCRKDSQDPRINFRGSLAKEEDTLSKIMISNWLSLRESKRTQWALLQVVHLLVES